MPCQVGGQAPQPPQAAVPVSLRSTFLSTRSVATRVQDRIAQFHSIELT